MANSIGYEANPIAFSTGNLYFDIAANALQVLAIWFFVLWAERKIGTKIIYGTIGLVVIAAIDMLNDLWVGGII